MTPKKAMEQPEDESRGVLDDAASIDTTAIGIIGSTAQVSVELPKDDEDDLDDDGVVDGEIIADLIVDAEQAVPAGAFEPVSASDVSEVSFAAPIIIELPPQAPSDPVAAVEHPRDAGERSASPESAQVEADAEETDVVVEDVAEEAVVVAAVMDEDVVGDDDDDEQRSPSGDVGENGIDAALEPVDVQHGDVEADLGLDDDVEVDDVSDDDDTQPDAVDDDSPAEIQVTDAEHESALDREPLAEPEPFLEPEPVVEPEPVHESEPLDEDESLPDADPAPTAEPGAAQTTVESPGDLIAAEAATAAAFVAKARADTEPSALTRKSAARSMRAEKENTAVETSNAKPTAVQPTRASRSEVHLSAKRLDDLGEASRESADLLTADRLLDPHRITKPEPEGAWSHFLYTISGRRINIGDGKRARERKALTARIAAPLVGGARFIPVLSRKGGVGKTTITTLMGMALADAREDRVIAVDANPDRGTLAERVVHPHHNRSVRDLVRIHDEVRGYHDLSAIVARDATRLDVLASDGDPRIAEAFSDSDYRDVAGVAAHYYSLVLTDTGTGIVHSVMSATLDLADQIVIVSGLSVDEARLASETLTWLETNGYAEQAREAVVVLNQSTPGAPLVRLNELEGHFRTRAKHVVRMPYDAQIAGGGVIVFANLQPETRVAARELAALLVEGLRAKAA